MPPARFTVAARVSRAGPGRIAADTAASTETLDSTRLRSRRGDRSTSDRDAIMAGLLQSHDERFGFRINHRLARVGAGKFLHRSHRIEPEQRNEFHFIAVFADEQFRAAIAVNLSGGYARKK